MQIIAVRKDQASIATHLLRYLGGVVLVFMSCVVLPVITWISLLFASATLPGSDHSQISHGSMLLSVIFGPFLVTPIVSLFIASVVSIHFLTHERYVIAPMIGMALIFALIIWRIFGDADPVATGYGIAIWGPLGLASAATLLSILPAKIFGWVHRARRARIANETLTGAVIGANG